MKKLLSYKFFLLLTSMASMVFTSCLKDERFRDGEYQTINANTEGQEWVSIPLAARPNKIHTVGVLSNPTAQPIDLFPVSYDFENPAPQDITITLTVNNNLLTAANTALAADNKQTLTALPTSAYTLPSMTITVPSGQRISAPFKMSLSTDVLDPTKIYGIGFTITSVSKSGVNIPSNLKDVVVAISIKNKYDAIYTYFGKYNFPGDRPAEWTRTEFKYPFETALITTGPKSVTFYNDAFKGTFLPLMVPGASGFGGTALDIVFDNNDKVISVNNPTPDARNRQFALDPSGNSRYDAAKKTLYLDLIFTQNGFAPAPINIRMEYLKQRP